MPDTTPPSASHAGESVSVRMYRGILGDFFVLTHRLGSLTWRALIDCGALQCIGASGSKPATQRSLDRLGKAIDDFLSTVDHRIDLVIATHEHFDHLSGFMKYHDKFRNPPFEVGQVWLAWTENDGDQLALDIKAGRSKGLAALTALAGDSTHEPNLRAFGINPDEEAAKHNDALKEARASVEAIRNLLQFYGEIDPPVSGMGLTAGAPRVPRDPPRSCADVFAWLKGRAGDDKVRYLEPGEQIRFGLDNRLLASVLGPPRTRKRLLQMDPSDDPQAREVYLTSPDDYDSLIATMSSRYRASTAMAGPSTETPAASAADAMPSDVEIFQPVDPDKPFDARFDRWPKSEQKEDLPDTVTKLYFNPDRDHVSRRIDGDWLGAAETLGIKIDGDVNNSSLALAIEVPGRHVLLFPADAQVGNWLSWHDQTYPSKPGVKLETGETAADILSRVVLYKVGHHGSHNATAKEMGLELMTSPNLVAMIPVVEDVAGEQKTRSNPEGWAMPYADLNTRLKAKTSGRIVRGDGNVEDERQAFAAGLLKLDFAPGDDPLWAELSLAL